MKVLLVDDSLVDRMIIESFLQDLGHEVVIGENGQEAVQLYQQHEPDLVLLDEVMPVMKGREAAQRIRELEENWVPIIFLSACFSADDIAAGIRAGGDDYLAKPVEQKILAAKMEAMQRIAEMRRKLLKLSEELEHANQELKHLVDVDGLTGLSNRRYIDRFLEHEIARCARSRQTITVIMCDIDYFKYYNDHYGHLKGDDCLRLVAGALKDFTRRATDLAGRYGGEEFLIVLIGLDPKDAYDRAEVLRSSVEQLNIPHDKSKISHCVTLSAGVFSIIPDAAMTSEQLLAIADKALYSAKLSGRNRVKLSDKSAGVDASTNTG